jgi:nucleotide-binding universal stress UspA family protein
MKSIVLATDGSPSAAEATLRAVELARALDATLIAVSVEHVTVPAYGYYGYADVVTELAKMEYEHVDETLARAKAVATDAGVRCELVHATGAISEEICAIAADHHARLIVVGAHGWGPVRRLLHGSVSSAILHEASCPVLVVRAPEHGVENGMPAQTEQARA